VGPLGWSPDGAGGVADRRDADDQVRVPVVVDVADRDTRRSLAGHERAACSERLRQLQRAGSVVVVDADPAADHDRTRTGESHHHRPTDHDRVEIAVRVEIAELECRVRVRADRWRERTPTEPKGAVGAAEPHVCLSARDEQVVDDAVAV
jgi:hypothetical protein